jgi:hypothetical protein
MVVPVAWFTDGHRFVSSLSIPYRRDGAATQPQRSDPNGA